MKKIVLLIALTCSMFSAAAQYGPGYRPGYGPGYGPGYDTGYGPGYGTGYGRSYRPDQRIEVGIGLTGIGDISSVYRNSFAELYGEYRGFLNEWFDVGVQLFFTGGKGRNDNEKLTPLVGVGRTYGYYNYPTEDFSGWGRGWCIDPRIGLELFERLRLTAHLRCSFADRIGTYGAISVGWTFNPYRHRHRRNQQPRDPSTLQPRIR